MNTRRSVGYRASRPFAQFVGGAIPSVLIHARNRQAHGLNLLAARKIELHSKSLYIRSYDSKVSGRGNEQFYTIDIDVTGDADALHELAKDINSGAGKLFENGTSMEDREISSLMSEASRLSNVPLRQQARLAITIRTPDERLIVKNTCLSVLRHLGSWHALHAETDNSSSKFPGTGEFYITGVAGFPTVGHAEEAAVALQRMPYDSVEIVKLYREVPLRLAA